MNNHSTGRGKANVPALRPVRDPSNAPPLTAPAPPAPRAVSPAAGLPRRLAVWLVWHAVELAAVAAPLSLAAVTTAWVALLDIPIVAAWVAHERRLTRRGTR